MFPPACTNFSSPQTDSSYSSGISKGRKTCVFCDSSRISNGERLGCPVARIKLNCRVFPLHHWCLVSLVPSLWNLCWNLKPLPLVPSLYGLLSLKPLSCLRRRLDASNLSLACIDRRYCYYYYYYYFFFFAFCRRARSVQPVARDSRSALASARLKAQKNCACSAGYLSWDIGTNYKLSLFSNCYSNLVSKTFLLVDGYYWNDLYFRHLATQCLWICWLQLSFKIFQFRDVM